MTNLLTFALALAAVGVVAADADVDVVSPRFRFRRQTKKVAVGKLTRTSHNVAGDVSTQGDDTIIIDNFHYDGRGFGVYIDVALNGSSRREYVASRQIVPYPDPNSLSPIERRYDGETLTIKLPAGVSVKDIKWLSRRPTHDRLAAAPEAVGEAVVAAICEN